MLGHLWAQLFRCLSCRALPAWMSGLLLVRTNFTERHTQTNGLPDRLPATLDSLGYGVGVCAGMGSKS